VSIHLPDRAHCVGCGACASVCPAQCIRMERDEEGFRRPVVREEACLLCGACEMICPVRNPDPRAEPFATYAAVNPDDETRRASTSGGVFSLLAQQVLDLGGVVYGGAFDRRFTVRHAAARTRDELALLRGSKYMESDLGDTFSEVKQLLDRGVPVLYSGVPCQIAGLRSFLGIEHPLLLTVDLVCHGAPSPLAWEAYLAERERAAGAKALRVAFRDKAEGWRHSSLFVIFENGAAFRAAEDGGAWMRAFLHGLSIRRSCFSCPYRTNERPGDITLADFWGIEKVTGERDDDLGVSIVRANSAQGRNALASVADRLQLREVAWEDAVRRNRAALHPTPPQPKREDFFARLGKEPFAAIVGDLLRQAP